MRFKLPSQSSAKISSERRRSLKNPVFDDWILEDIKKSGLNLENLPIEPLQSEYELRERLGFDKMGSTKIINIGGYWIPYPNLSGYYRLKLKEIIGDIKYLSPKGTGNHAYILHEVFTIAAPYKPDKPILFTEGEKKAAKATLEGFPCIGLSGVWCFKDSESEFLPELDDLNFKQRKCYICFDSDIKDKINVRQAEIRLSIELMNRGAQVFAIRFPKEANGDKNGLDDFLLCYDAEAFKELMSRALPTLELHIEEGTDKELILDELYRLRDKIHQEQVLKALAKREGVKLDLVRTEYQKRIPKEEENRQPLQETFTEKQLEAAYSLLNSPNILSNVVSFTKELGFIGEEINQKALYLCFTSRLMDSSISAVVKGQSSSGKSHLVNTNLRLFPETEILNFSFVTSKALVHREGDLSHKILSIAEHSGSEGADYSIRTMLSEGEISIMLPMKNEITGNFDTVEKRVPAKGLVFVETTTRDRIHTENQTRVFDLYVDESEEQTTNILSMQASQLETGSPDVDERVKVWRAAQSLLKKYVVYIPYAQELANAFPKDKTRARRDYPRLLSLVRSHALLFQYQREVDENGRLIATLEDLAGVLLIIERVLQDSLRALSPNQAEVLNIIHSDEVLTEFSVSNLSELVDLDRKTLRRYLKYFANEGLIEWNGERGRKSQYTKVTSNQSQMSPMDSFISKIHKLLEKTPENSGQTQMSPNVSDTPIVDDKGHLENKGHSAMPPKSSNDDERISEHNGIGDIGTKEKRVDIPSNDNKEAEVRNSEEWEAEKQDFLGQIKKEVGI